MAVVSRLSGRRAASRGRAAQACCSMHIPPGRMDSLQFAPVGEEQCAVGNLPTLYLQQLANICLLDDVKVLTT